MKKKIAITGGTGLIGTALAKMFRQSGNEVMILTRSPQKINNPVEGVEYIGWDIGKHQADLRLAEAQAIIHLAGVPVMEKRWNSTFKQKIISSRVESAKTLVKFLKENPHQVKHFITASAIGWYGPDDGRQPFREHEPADQHFLGESCRLWEEASRPVEEMGLHWNACRTGIVFSKEGGAFSEFYNPVKRFHVAPVLGDGRQMVSWIHIDDLCGIYGHLLDNPGIKGAVNGVAPNPVSNRDLMMAIARKLHGKAFLPVPVPSWGLKMALGENSIEILKSATVSAEKIMNNGFVFKYPALDAALNELIVE